MTCSLLGSPGPRALLGLEPTPGKAGRTWVGCMSPRRRHRSRNPLSRPCRRLVIGPETSLHCVPFAEQTHVSSLSPSHAFRALPGGQQLPGPGRRVAAHSAPWAHGGPPASSALHRRGRIFLAPPPGMGEHTHAHRGQEGFITVRGFRDHGTRRAPDLPSMHWRAGRCSVQVRGPDSHGPRV